MARVDICVCTFRRSFLAETLRSIGRLDPGDHEIRVIVADNDMTPTARELVGEARRGLPFPLHYIHAPGANISIARNACLDAATGDFIAFVDDDEVVGRDWIRALVEQAHATGAAAVLGPVRAIYTPSAPAWMVEGDFHSTLPVFVNGEIRTGYTCNVLVRWDPPFRDVRFDPALGRSGGEDTDFFNRLVAFGGMIAFAPDAKVEEPVPADRATMSWLVRRRLRFGQTHGMLMGGSRAVTAVAAVSKVGYCCTMAGLMAFSPINRRRNWLRAVLHIGVLGGLIGVRQRAHYGETSSL
mgnify:CR=1 FL=1